MTRASNKGFGVVLCDRLRADQPRRSTARTRCGRRAVPGDPDRRRRHPPLSGVPARRPPLPAFEAGDPAELIEARVAPGRTALAPFQYEVTADASAFWWSPAAARPRSRRLPWCSTGRRLWPVVSDPWPVASLVTTEPRPCRHVLLASPRHARSFGTPPGPQERFHAGKRG